MTSEFVRLSRHVRSRVHEAPIEQEPFPHLVVPEIVPTDVYERLLEHLPLAAQWGRAEYPGTGRFTTRHGGQPTSGQDAAHVGLVLQDWQKSPLLEQLHAFFAGEPFARLLLDKFSAPGSRGPTGRAVPVEKLPWFCDGARGVECVFGMYKDLANYEISPHRDHPSKVVTFLWYLSDDGPAPCGTLLCRPKPTAALATAGSEGYAQARREGRAGLWLDWSDFDVVKEVAGRNVFLAFAPNEISYHGVRLDGAGGISRERTVVRGFIARTGYRDTRIVDDRREETTASA